MNITHSEELFGISTPPYYTCPNIDDYLLDAQLIRVHLEKVRHLMINLIDAQSVDIETNSHKKTANDEINLILDRYLVEIEEGLEKLRTSNEEIRTWGSEWKRLAKDHLTETELTKMINFKST